MATAQKFEDFEIWQLVRTIALSVFKLTKENEKLSKDYKLKDQMTASSGSIMDNIAEGFGRGSRLEFVQFLSIENGSSDELKSQFYRCLDREYILKDEFDNFTKWLIKPSEKFNQ